VIKIGSECIKTRSIVHIIPPSSPIVCKGEVEYEFHGIPPFINDEDEGNLEDGKDDGWEEITFQRTKIGRGIHI